MNNSLDKRLDQILPVITSDDFLKAAGLGNELAFHIFDYPPEKELHVRKHIQWLLEQLPHKRAGIQAIHINLFTFLVNYLRERGLLDKAFKMQSEKGDAALMKALRGPLHEQKLAEVFAKASQPEKHDIVLVSGVGNVYPLLRSHTLLNNLHSIMGQTPLVLFYPGCYDGVSLRLFGKSTLTAGIGVAGDKSQTPYYRAFRLIPEEPLHAH
ncbi:MAG: DUF1788 domain-containing protein [Candidatus Hydrogenedentes bacterium]|nr:DUF1788 domain-containing protein [Candidatus Hydrogenedentota bacterium]